MGRKRSGYQERKGGEDKLEDGWGDFLSRVNTLAMEEHDEKDKADSRCVCVGECISGIVPFRSVHAG
jgi:hypothetical protein